MAGRPGSGCARDPAAPALRILGARGGAGLRPQRPQRPLRRDRPPALGPRWPGRDLPQHRLRRDVEPLYADRRPPCRCHRQRPGGLRVGRATSPAGSAFVLAATQHGIFRSDDGGQTWSHSSTGLPHDDALELAISPSQAAHRIRDSPHDGPRWAAPGTAASFAARTAGARGSFAPRACRLASVRGTERPPEMTSCCKEIVVDPDRSGDRLRRRRSLGERRGPQAPPMAVATLGSLCLPDGERERSIADYGWITNWGPSVELPTISPVDPEAALLSDPRARSTRRAMPGRLGSSATAARSRTVASRARVSRSPVSSTPCRTRIRLGASTSATSTSAC